MCSHSVCRYEKARKLKDYIDDIRATYQRNWDSKDRQERQASAPLGHVLLRDGLDALCDSTTGTLVDHQGTRESASLTALRV